MYFWDFAQAVWTEMGYERLSWTINSPMGSRKILGTPSEFVSKLVGKEPGFTKDRIYYDARHRWFNIEKARRVLGYEPDVGVGKGINRAVAICHFFCSWCG